MSVNRLNKISIIGTGNVATHLSRAFLDAGCEIKQVYGRDPARARTLAQALKAGAISSLEDLDQESDVYFCCIADNALEEILPQINIADKLIVHTSGSLAADIFAEHFRNFGVFYPLQTFSSGREFNFNDIPICIEANDPGNEELLTFLALRISSNIQLVDAKRRMLLHAAAVFACNFTNYMYSIAEDILTEHHLDPNLLKPLIRETASKVMETLSHEVQTGPARRHDQLVIDNHIKLLDKYPEYQALYSEITQQIMKKYKT
ncbi:MAG: F420-dependent NADP oxidoreductase [Bacteroidota bacterium]|nr:F420-dependent NADP oxidoreductase [Bacteroidota bacterium]